MMKKNMLRFSFLVILYVVMLPKIFAQQSSYPLLKEKSWSQIMEENKFKWQPPYTINLLIHPLHSPDWIYLNPSKCRHPVLTAPFVEEATFFPTVYLVAFLLKKSGVHRCMDL